MPKKVKIMIWNKNIRGKDRNEVKPITTPAIHAGMVVHNRKK